MINFRLPLLLVAFLLPLVAGAQTFTRTSLAPAMNTPWEIIYGPDGFLWVAEASGTVSRVDPLIGFKTVVYSAPDYFGGAASEEAPCGRAIGANTYGMALHPDFLNPDNAFIYLIYSYNAGTGAAPNTLFKIVKLTWDARSGQVVSAEDLVTELPNGFDHFGYRMIAVRQVGKDYLYYSIGDLGSNDASCYPTPADNPNLQAQNPDVANGKIHRINIDGTVPSDNPIAGNTFFTRGHRNPQGLAYNPEKGIVYDIEHGHKTDDEINVLEAGLNYGWMDVQGYHDGNYPDELPYVNGFTPHPEIANDRLKEPLFSWGAEPEPNGGFLNWPTPAPSDGIYYGSDGISEWTNSLLVVTLKNGDDTDQEVYQFKLNPDGTTLTEATADAPNPKRFFGEDQGLNGRLRDIAISPDGKKIFLITNNFGDAPNPIIVYTLEELNSTANLNHGTPITVSHYPNPFASSTTISYETEKPGRVRIEVMNAFGVKVKTLEDDFVAAGQHSISWNGDDRSAARLPSGLYFYVVHFERTRLSRKVIISR